MSTYPIRLPGNDSHLWANIYALLGVQIQAYQKHYRLGENTSVSVDTAQGLMLSMSYCMSKVKITPGEGNVAGILARGQQIVQAQAEQVKELAGLVRATAPAYASDYYQDTLSDLERFLDRYDPLFFAHRVPAFLDYPLLEPVSDSLQGVDYMAGWLRSLWWENQILHFFPDGAVCEVMEASAPDFWGTPLNMVEQPLYNALGRCLLGLPAEELLLTDDHRQQFLERLRGKTGREIRLLLDEAMEKLCTRLGLKDRGAERYAQAVVPQLLPRLRAAVEAEDLKTVLV